MARKKTSKTSRTPAARRGYLHGYTSKEQERLITQARVTEPLVHDRLPFRRSRSLVEVGSGVGAQTEILLRHFPELRITCVERNPKQITAAKRYLSGNLPGNEGLDNSMACRHGADPVVGLDAHGATPGISSLAGRP